MEKRIEPQVTSEYRKDSQDEAFLERLNNILEPYQEEEYKDTGERYPTLHVVGAPRSGTTLLMQLLAAHTNIGYINNLIAAFWRAPTYGIQLSKKLIPSGMTSSYSSNFGRTHGVSEPHEFGYFWSSLLSYKNMREPDAESKWSIDWNRVRMILNNMVYAFSGPIVFKSFLLGWHMERMQKTMPETCWVRIKRDPVQNALSILDLRQKMLGTQEGWASLKPKEYKWLKNEPYWRQVAGQVYFLEKSHTEQLLNLPQDKILDITYEELCNDPHRIMEKVCLLLRKNRGGIEMLSQPPVNFTQDIYSVKSHPAGTNVEEAIVSFYKEDNNA